MGLAASQARYLALSARKTNCEYEGQQINQQRLTLSNQSANLFNQMLTMSVPMPPSTVDFTTLQYSWSDGDQNFVIDNYYQLATIDEEYNYVVSYYHYEDVYTGQRKYLNDPQVSATKINHFSDLKTTHYTLNSIAYNQKKDTYTLNMQNSADQEVEIIYELSDQDRNKDTVEELDFIYGRTTTDSNVSSYTYDEDAKTVTSGGTTYTYVDPDGSVDELAKLKTSYGAWYDPTKKYFKSGTKYVCWDDIATAQMTGVGDVIIRDQDTKLYYTDGKRFISRSVLRSLEKGDPVETYSATNNPTFTDYKSVGNCELHALTTDEYNEQVAIQTEIKQIMADMAEGDPTAYARLSACFDDAGNYITGSIYMFTMAGKTYYTTTADLDESLASAYDEQSAANNSIDSQQSKLSYYKAIYLNTKISETKKALLETDGNGRFSTAKFEDDSVVYTLNVESITDEEGYNDAMNKYYFQKDEYDKQVADINAKTEVIQAQDRQLQLKLEQLGTEQTALQTEMEACQKVVSKSIEEGFKTFGS